MTEFETQLARMTTGLNWLDSVLQGGESDVVNMSGVIKPSISKAIKDYIDTLKYSYKAAETIDTKKIAESTGTVSPSVYKLISWVSGKGYVITAYAKKAEKSLLNFYCNNGAIFSATFDLDAGTATGSGAAINALGNNWYLCSVLVTASSTASANLQFRLYNTTAGGSYAGDGTSGIYIDKVALYESGTNTNLLPSTNLADAAFTKQNCVVNVATIFNNDDYNLIKINKSSIDALNAVVIAQQTADKLVEGGGTVSPSIYRSYTFVNGTQYTFSIDVKKGERHLVNLYCGSGLVLNATFDLINGTASGAGATITRLKTDEYRCAVTGTATASSAANLQIRLFNNSGAASYTGDGNSGLYINAASFIVVGSTTNLLSNASNFAGSGWLKQGLTVSADVALFGGLENSSSIDWGKTKWSSKKVVAIGDSITAQGFYTSPLASLLGCTLTNLGTSGGSIASGSHYGSLYIYNAVQNIATDSDVVIVECGINDFGTDNSTLGTLGDITTATFYGAIFATVQAIRARATTAKIIFLTPFSGDASHATHRIQRTNAKGHKLEQFQDAVWESALYCGCYCVDVGRKSGIGYFTGSLYMSDGLHLNAAGGNRYAAYVAEELLALARSGYLS